MLAAELVAAVAEFLESDVRDADVPNGRLADERALAAAIRAGDLDDRGAEVIAILYGLVRRRLSVAHPGYDNP